jgi:hypothetical protein
MRELKDLVYGRLWDQFRCVSDYSVNCAGYLGKAKYNLVSGLKIADFEDELQSEIIKKQRGNKPPRFYAVHSSAALVVNTFGIWKNSPHTLELCGKTGFEKITFEKQCPTGLIMCLTLSRKKWILRC